MQIVADEWLTSVLGRDVFRVALDQTDGDLKPIATMFLADHVANQQAAFYYAKIPTHQIALTQTMAACGFYVVDVNVTLNCEWTSTATMPKTAETFEVRAATGMDFDQAITIAGSCFQFSRFHLDPAISLALANRVKEEWIR